jgi:hypothetical protein
MCAEISLSELTCDNMHSVGVISIQSTPSNCVKLAVQVFCCHVYDWTTVVRLVQTQRMARNHQSLLVVAIQPLPVFVSGRFVASGGCCLFSVALPTSGLTPRIELQRQYLCL